MEMGAFLAAVGAGLAIGISGMGSGIGVGITGAAASGVVAEKPEKFGMCLVFQALPQTQAIYGLLTAILIMMGTGLLGGGAEDIPVSVGLVAVGCGLAVGFAGLSAIGQGIAASGGIGAATEKSGMFGKGMVFSILPETQAIYGLLIAILLMAFTGMFTKQFDVTVNQGMAVIGAGLAVGIAGLSAIGQGITASAAIGATTRNPDAMGKGLIFAVMSETFAIFGLLVAILIIFGVGLMK
ncbi:MAG: V-type ATP synthase subunit K [Euryarchaeota archaeon CG_4_9_14_3_um_filter_38_12]|nr:MAG: V-type ATP synthase subunit K [Euryarchaeota archaeon CG_4_9_14_3_um_filter_38_12]